MNCTNVSIIKAFSSHVLILGLMKFMHLKHAFRINWNANKISMCQQHTVPRQSCAVEDVILI